MLTVPGEEVSAIVPCHTPHLPPVCVPYASYGVPICPLRWLCNFHGTHAIQITKLTPFTPPLFPRCAGDGGAG
jgi:hypothetical protein